MVCLILEAVTLLVPIACYSIDFPAGGVICCGGGGGVHYKLCGRIFGVDCDLCDQEPPVEIVLCGQCYSYVCGGGGGGGAR